MWFFSLEASSLAVTVGLRQLGLPYEPATTVMRRQGAVTQYASRRRSGDGLFAAEVHAGKPLLEHDPLAVFLTGRWNAFSQRWGRLWRVPIEHEPWPLHSASARVDAAGLLRADNLPALGGEPVAHFAPLVHVRLGAPRLA